MHKGRMEAFSDGVLAIIITIMVLELKVPHDTGINALFDIAPTLLCYLLSFVYIGIYWNNHHHLFQAAQKVTGGVLWANLHLLFWLSLVPFATGWMGENHFATIPVAVYGVILWMAGFAYYILTKILIRAHGNDSFLAIAIGRDNKGLLSTVLYSVAIFCAFLNVKISMGIYVLVALIWFVPDRRIEKSDPHNRNIVS